jgi:hypothetical protein
MTDTFQHCIYTLHNGSYVDKVFIYFVRIYLTRLSVAQIT